MALLFLEMGWWMDAVREGGSKLGLVFLKAVLNIVTITSFHRIFFEDLIHSDFGNLVRNYNSIKYLFNMTWDNSQYKLILIWYTPVELDYLFFGLDHFSGFDELRGFDGFPFTVIF